MNQPINNNFGYPTAEVPPSMPPPAERLYPSPVTVETLDHGQLPYWEVLANPYSAELVAEQQDLEAALEVERWAILNAQERERYGSDAEVYQEFLSAMMDHFKTSEIVQKFRQQKFPDGQPQPSDWRQLFSEFERARQYAFGQVDMSPEQRQRLLQAKSELNYSIRELALHGAENAMDCMLMVFPKKRKVQYMDSQEIITYLKRSGSIRDTEQFKKQVQLDKDALAEHQDLPQVQAALADPEFPTDYDDVGESGLPFAA